MTRKTYRTVSRISLGFAVLWATPGFGQTIINGGTAAENVSTAAGRTPGQMVNAGVARALAAANFARTGVTITETREPMSITAVALVNALPTLFTQLNVVIAYFEDLLRARAGLPPRVRDTTTPPDTDGRDGSRAPK